MNRSLLNKMHLKGSSEQMAVWCPLPLPVPGTKTSKMKHHSHGPKPCCPVPIKSESFPGPEPGQAAAAGQQRWRRSQAPARGLCWTAVDCAEGFQLKLSYPSSLSGLTPVPGALPPPQSCIKTAPEPNSLCRQTSGLQNVQETSRMASQVLGTQ